MNKPTTTEMQIWSVTAMIQGVDDQIEAAKHDPIIELAHWEGRHIAYCQVLRMLENTLLQERKEPIELILAKIRRA